MESSSLSKSEDVQAVDTAFEIGDVDQWRDHLEREGFTVIRNVLSDEQVDQVKSSYFDWLESLGSGIKRDDVSTWKTSQWPGSLHQGCMESHGAGQTEAAWLVRSNPNVIRAFQEVWRTDEQLLTSMDTFLCWRPWNTDKAGSEDWKPKVGRMHIDHNPLLKPGLQCIQGMIPMFPVTKQVGGLQIVPQSHNPDKQAELAKTYSENKTLWLQLDEGDKHLAQGRLILADPGSLILWDARCIHGGYVGKGPLPDEERLLRLSMTVAMSPISKWDRSDPTHSSLLENRVQAVKSGWTLNHWPHEFYRHPDYMTQKVESNYKPPAMDQTRLGLLRGPDIIEGL